MTRHFDIQDTTAPNRRRTIHIISNIFFALCFLILLIAIVVAVQAKQSGRAVEIFGWQPYLIATGSMEPTYSINGVVITHNDDIGDVKVGDVVSFAAAGLQGKVAFHRVIAINCADLSKTVNECPTESKQFWTKGDNNPRPDGAPVTAENYIGKARFNTNMTAFWINEFNKPNGLIRVIVMPIIVLILLFFGTRWLITTPETMRGRMIAFCLVIFLISSSVLTSYTLYIVKQVDKTNSSLSDIAIKFAKSDITTEWKVMNEPVVGRIEIPALKLDYPIIDYNQLATTLSLTIAHFDGSLLNSAGNAVLVGHKAFGDLSPFNLFFTHIDELKQGDEIFITDRNRQRVRYIVQYHGEISDDSDEISAQPEDEHQVTLVSASYTFNNRYIVRAVASE